MAIRPIIFSGPMIRALLEGRKTQTRRIIKPRPWNADGDTVDISIAKSAAYVQGADAQWYYSFEHPLGGPLTAYVSTFNRGDLLYVREAWQWDRKRHCSCPQGSEPSPCDDWSNGTGCKSNRDGVVYAADWMVSRNWKPSIHMPRWASRLTLAVTDVRVQRLRDISRDDSIAEGATVRPACYGYKHQEDGWSMNWDRPGLTDSLFAMATPQSAFLNYWNSLHGQDAAAKNPWVVAVTFDVHKVNVDHFVDANKKVAAS